MHDRATRCRLFLDWATTRGVGVERLPFVRGFAEQMLAQAGDGPVMQAAVDAVVAGVAAGADGPRGVPFVRKVGELLLEFERETWGAPSVVPPAEPEAVGAGPVGADGAGTPVGSEPGPTARAGSAHRFRCPTCRIYVAPTVSGACPKCGKPPPRGIDLGGPPASSSSPSGTSTLVRVLGVGVAVVTGAVGAWFGGQLARSACSSEEPSVAVSGPYRAEELGVEVVFGPGWRRIEKVESEQVGLVSAKQQMFFRGGTSDDPDLGLVLGAAALGAGLSLEGLADLPEPGFRALVEEGVRGMVRGAGGKIAADPAECEILRLGRKRVGRCSGTATDGGERRGVLVYFWIHREKLGLALFFSRVEAAAARVQADQVVETIRPL